MDEQQPMTVADLRDALADVNGDLPVFLEMRGWLGDVEVKQKMVILQRMLDWPDITDYRFDDEEITDYRFDDEETSS